MSKLYLEWVEKAEGDYHTALREYRVRKYPNYDAACFHAQQCLEKYLKACLQREEIYFPKTHDLNALLDLLLSTHPLLEVIRNDLKLISSYGVEVRYPRGIRNQRRSPGCDQHYEKNTQRIPPIASFGGQIKSCIFNGFTSV